jgi:hypothetical protein
MSTAIAEVRTLLDKLPLDSDYEDIQYHLYIIEKIRSSLARSKQEGTLSQAKVEQRLSQWLS